MYILDFFHFLYQGPTFLKLSPEFNKNDSRGVVEIENKPLLFTKESDYKYSIIKGRDPLLSIDVTTLNKVIEEWKNFSMHWVRGFGSTAIALAAVSAYQIRSSAVYFYPACAGTLLAGGLCLFTIRRIGQLMRRAEPKTLQIFIANCNNVRTEVFEKGLRIFDTEGKVVLRYDKILTIPETLFLLRRYLQEKFPYSALQELHETLPDLVCLLDQTRYPDEKEKNHCEALSQALCYATLNNPILNAYARVGSGSIFDIYDSLLEIDADEIEIPTLKSVIKTMLHSVESDDLEETKAWFIEKVEATANEKLKESLK